MTPRDYALRARARLADDTRDFLEVWLPDFRPGRYPLAEVWTSFTASSGIRIGKTTFARVLEHLTAGGYFYFELVAQVRTGSGGYRFLVVEELR